MDKKEQILVLMSTDQKEFVDPYLKARADETGYRFKIVYRDVLFNEQQLCEAVTDAAGYIVHLEKVSDAVLAAGKNLKIVSKLGVGTDNIDKEAAHRRGVEVANCPGSNSNAVAELTIGLMIGLARRTHKLCNDLRSRKWSADLGSELKGKTVGLLGFGNVGRRLALLLKPFETEILTYDTYVNEEWSREYSIRYTSLDEIAHTADYICIHLPLLESTRHLVDKKFLSKTKKGVFILNMARGGLVDEDALIEAVKSGQVAQAATDVFEHEPPFDSPLLDDERIIVLPHIGAATREAVLMMLGMAIDNIISVLEGKGNPHPV